MAKRFIESYFDRVLRRIHPASLATKASSKLIALVHYHNTLLFLDPVSKEGRLLALAYYHTRFFLPAFQEGQADNLL